MRWHLLFILLVLTMPAVHAYFINESPDAIEFRRYTFGVNISVSKTLRPVYATPFSRPGNFTITYNKVPKMLAGVAPKPTHITDTTNDVVRASTHIRLDPRTCANDLAYCYQILENNKTRTTFGRNYSAVSSYLLPQARIRTFVCIGNDTLCTSAATNCFCPQERANPPPVVHVGDEDCDESTHMCLDTYGSFALCKGNLTSCQEKYTLCGCGIKAACVAKRNTCVSSRDQLVICAGELATCLPKYKTCFCGPEMLLFQKGCTSLTHTCMKGNTTVVCNGAFNSCALQFDKCDC
jgi:hypothetical protein